jgi:hypothetical protein
MSMPLTFLPLLLVCVTSQATTLSSQKPGAWEFDTRIVGIAVDGTEIPARSEREVKCMTPQFVASGSYLSPTNRDGTVPGQCSVRDYSRAGPSATWAIECNLPGGKSRSDYKVRAEELTLRIEQHTEATRADGARGFVQVLVTARRVGECTPEMRELGGPR